MRIVWEKTPEREDEVKVAEFIEGKIKVIQDLLLIYIREGLSALSFTPQPLGGSFYTCEIKYHRHDRRYIINVWDGVRVGDGLPVIYGYLDYHE